MRLAFFRGIDMMGHLKSGQARPSMPSCHALTDDQWNQIEDLLPGEEGDPGRTAEDNRLFVDAILFVAKMGIP